MSKFEKLADTSEIIDSLHKTPEYSTVGHSMVRCTDVKYGFLNLHQTFKVNDSVFQEFSRRYTPQKGDIIITRVGSYGITAIVDDNHFCLGQNTSAIIPKKINSKYLYLALNSPLVKNQIEFSVVGSTQKTLSLKAIGELDIPRFDDDTENKIGKIGSEINEKIHLNTQTNQTLESIAQAIFKSWFVDFEPVKAKMAAKERWYAIQPTSESASPVCYANDTALPDLETYTNLAAMCAISGKSETELTQLQQKNPDHYQQLTETAALFPSAMVNSELGEIPVGWEVGAVEDLFELHRGYDLPKDARQQGEFVVYSAGGIHGSHCEFKMEPPGIITGRSGVIGNVYLCLEKYWPLNTTLYIRKFRAAGPFYAFFFLGMIDLSAINSGSAVPSLNRNFVHSLGCVIPQRKIIELFEGKVSFYFDKIKFNEKENKTLADLRDSILPKLLSGEIDLTNLQSELA